MHHIVAIIFEFSGENLVIIAWDDKGEKVELEFPIEYLLHFLDEVVEYAEEN